MADYMVGVNIPGYLPMDDEPFVGSAVEATDALIDDLDRLLGADESLFTVETPESGWVLDADTDYGKFLRGLRYNVASQFLDAGEAHVWVFDPEKMHDLGLHFWLVPCEEEQVC